MFVSNDDYSLIFTLAAGGGCSLATTPEKDNWVDKAGSLPGYICKIAKAVKKSGKSTSSSIAIAVSRVKKWAAGGGDVDADTKAKAAKAVAQWEALKAKSHKKLSRQDGSPYIQLSNLGSFNTDMVRTSWNKRESAARTEYRQSNPHGDEYAEVPYTYIKELWTDFIIVEIEGNVPSDGSPSLVKVPYTVSGDTVEFGDPIELKKVYVEVDDDLTPEEEALLQDILTLSTTDALDAIIALSKKG